MYLLMNKDIPVMKFDIVKRTFSSEVVEVERYQSPVPAGVSSIAGWLDNRKASKHNAHVRKLMSAYGCDKPEGFIRLTHAASITDTFWVRNEVENISWKDVSLFRNDFNEVISKLAFESVGIPDESFSTTCPELTTDGSFRKAFIKDNGIIYLYKRGTSHASNAGLEPYCEAMAGELTEHICSKAVHYDLVRLHNETA